MVAVVRVHKVGGPEVLTYEDIAVPAAGPGQVRVKQHAIGVNFVDTYFRSGLYQPPGGLPFVAGNEAAGEIVEVGSGVGEFKRGDRVAYVQGPGCYAAERVVPADRVVKLPDNISYEQAAGMMLKGLTVEYLVRRTFKLEKGMTALVHAAAGGVGLILCQWANHLGANVIGTVGSKDKAALAQANGCHHTILYRDEDFVARVKEITGGKLCDVVYDGIGKATFPGSLDCHSSARHVRELRQCVGPDRGLQSQSAAVQRFAVRHAADAQHLRRQAGGFALDGQRIVQGRRQRRSQNPGQPDLPAARRGESTSRSGKPGHDRLFHPHPVKFSSAQ